MTSRKQHIAELYKVFTKINSSDEAKRFLTDILTPQELESVAERWQLLKMLSKGVPQREISKKLGISISKITRGSNVLQTGQGGFEKIFKKMK